jgi:hypothetical protein
MKVPNVIEAQSKSLQLNVLLAVLAANISPVGRAVHTRAVPASQARGSDRDAPLSSCAHRAADASLVGVRHNVAHLWAVVRLDKIL